MIGLTKDAYMEAERGRHQQVLIADRGGGRGVGRKAINKA